MYIHHTLQRYIATALRDFDVREHDIHLEHPADFMHGDYAINSALIYARNRGIAPRELAEQFVQELTKDMPAYLERIEIAGPGFINLFLARPFLQSTLADIIADSVHYGRGSLLSGKRVLIEHSSPNLFKPFHIGHMMNNAIGESLVRTAEYVGGDVIALSYPSDISLGIGKAIWFLLSNGGKEALAERATLHEQILLLGSCYVQGVRAFDDTPEIQSDVREITRQIFEQEPTPAYELYTLCKQLNIDYFIAITKRLGSHFADFIFESEAGVRGQDMVRAHTPSVFRVSNGAHIYEGEQDGLHTRVFINAEGYPTYEAKDIGLLAIKFERYQLIFQYSLPTMNKKNTIKSF
ncbi:MAG: arginine--tRNA ligase [Candidatus Pacebacteria bacterium]|nr:arginine--tRNA ligase [Candidatus Paceibacterota bacterium]